MAQVTIEINGRSHTVGCGAGEEQRLLGLSKYVDAKVRELAASVGPVGEARLLLLACLTLADELSEAYHDAEEGRSAASARDEAAQAAETRARQLQDRVGDIDAQVARREDALARQLEQIVRRLGAVAERLDAPQ
jgi:cell division protein ZapA